MTISKEREGEKVANNRTKVKGRIEWERWLPPETAFYAQDVDERSSALSVGAASVEALRRIAEELYQMRTGKSEWTLVQDAPHQGKGVKGREFGAKVPGLESAVKEER